MRAIPKKRIGNDFDALVEVFHEGVKIDLSLYEITSVRMVSNQAYKVTDYEVRNGSLFLHVTPLIVPKPGKYKIVVTYRMADPTLADGFWNYEFDKFLVTIVGSSEEEDAGDVVVSADAVIGMRGEPFRYSDFTPEQLESLKVKGDPFVYDDFTPEQIAILQQPASDIATTVSNAEGLRVTAESTRQTNETTRQQNEALRVQTEANRVAAGAMLKTAVKQTTGTSTTDVMSQKAVTEELAQLVPISPDKVDFIVTGKNIFNKEKIVTAKKLDPNDNINSDSVFNISSYIPVKQNTEYVASINQERVFFYSAQKLLIGSFGLWTSTGNFTTPLNCAYIRINIRTSDLSVFQIEKGVEATNYESFYQKFLGVRPDLTSIKKDDIDGAVIKTRSIPESSLSKIAIGKNLFNKNDIVNGFRLNIDDTVISDFSKVISSYIPVEQNTEYVASINQERVFFYSAQKLLIGSFGLWTSTGNFTTPLNCAYIRITVHVNNLNIFQIEKGNLSTSYSDYLMTAFENTPVRFPKINLTDVRKIINWSNVSDFMMDDIILRKEKDIIMNRHTECIVPTYDMRISIAHPSVVYNDDAWNGYKFWMAMTPYPPATRENPHIIASNNGYYWEVPNGAKNPLFSVADAVALGYGANSDTHLMLSPDKSKLMLYFRPMYGKGEGIVLMESLDGITWSAPIEVLTIPYTLSQDGYTKEYISMMSPSILFENEYTMWYINQSHGDKSKFVEKRTSSDGINWSVQTACTLPLMTYSAYHLDVVKKDNVYHMLLLMRENLRLKHLTSIDGNVWTEDVNFGYFPLSGFTWDKNGHYRSSIILKPNGKFDLWINGIEIGINGAFDSSSKWRIAYYRDFEFASD